MNNEDFSTLINYVISNNEYNTTTFTDRDPRIVVISEKVSKLHILLRDYFRSSYYIYETNISIERIERCKNDEYYIIIRIFSGVNSNKFFHLSLSFSVYVDEDFQVYFKPFGSSLEYSPNNEDVLKFVLTTLINYEK